jgi:hypothetical protein
MTAGERRDPDSALDRPQLRLRLRKLAIGCLLVGATFLTNACGGQQAGTGPTTATNATAAPGATGGGAPTATTKATLHVKGSDGNRDWDLEGPASPIDSIIAGPWTTTVPNAAGHDEVVTLTISGTVAPGTRPTNTLLSLEIAWFRDSVAGAAAFDLDFVSTAGECQITMSPDAAGQAGTFTCTGLVSDDGDHTINAEGTFAR